MRGVGGGAGRREVGPVGLYTGGAWRDFLSLESGSARPGPAVSVSAWRSLLRSATAARRAQCCSSPARERCRRRLAPSGSIESESVAATPRVSERGPLDAATATLRSVVQPGCNQWGFGADGGPRRALIDAARPDWGSLASASARVSALVLDERRRRRRLAGLDDEAATMAVAAVARGAGGGGAVARTGTGRGGRRGRRRRRGGCTGGSQRR